MNAATGCLLAVSVLIAGGCGSGRPSVLDQGVTLGPMRTVHRIGTNEAIADARSAHAEWLDLLGKAARDQPRRRFESPPRSVLIARLQMAARRFDFRIRSVTLHRSIQVAPEVVIESSDYVALARALRAVVDSIDPPPRSNRRAYEGIFVKAVDEDGVPFVIVFDSLRGQIAGGQWARADALFPYEHL